LRKKKTQQKQLERPIAATTKRAERKRMERTLKCRTGESTERDRDTKRERERGRCNT
jgi:hypothetical protein